MKTKEEAEAIARELCGARGHSWEISGVGEALRALLAALYSDQ